MNSEKVFFLQKTKVFENLNKSVEMTRRWWWWLTEAINDFLLEIFFSSMKLYYLRWYTQAPQGITFYCTGCNIKVPTKREYYILDRTANNFVNMIFNVWIRWAFLLMGENLWNVKYIQSLTIAIVFELIYYTNGHPRAWLTSINIDQKCHAYLLY